MRLGKMLSVGEVVEQAPVEEPTQPRPEPVAEVVLDVPVQVPVVEHADR
jgi:hypothetical protein